MPGKYQLRLFVTGQSAASIGAVSNVRAFCDADLEGAYELEVIDVLKRPDEAATAEILATPTLIKVDPQPVRRLIGDLGDRAQILAALDDADERVDDVVPGKAPLRLLVVEDSQADLVRIRAYLSEGSLGADIVHAPSLQAACGQLATDRFDAVVLDLWLPDAKGTDGVSRVRAADAEVPILVLTGIGDERIGAQVVQAGAQDYVCKRELSAGSLSRALHQAIERKRVTLRYAGLESLFGTVITHVADAIVITDRNGIIRYVNPAAEALFARPAAQLTGRSLGGYAGADRAETEILRPDGEPRLGELRTRSIEFDGGPGSLISIRDVTERKRAEEMRLESEARFRDLADNIRDVFWIWDVKRHRLLYVSQTYEQVWGRPPAQIHVHDFDWLDAVHPDDHDRVSEAFYRDAPAGTYREEFRIVRPDGDVRWVHDRGFPVADTDGEVQRIAGIAEDITERRQLEHQLRQSQKMEGIGRLAGGIAHDFNNILTAILGYSEMLMGQIGEDKPIHADLAEIHKAGERAAELTRSLLAFSRRQVLNLRPVDLNGVVRNLQPMLRRVIREDINFDTRMAEALPATQADTTQLEQILMNLVVNARDAMENGGDLVVATGVKEVADGDESAPVPMAPGRYVVLAVSDTGCGMDENTRSRLFEPFFTTKQQGAGTGLGLATVYGTVKQLGGYVFVYSELGKGTTFRLYFPVTSEQPQDATRPATVARPLVGSETVLLVEDDILVRPLAVKTLKRHGYRVLEAATPEEALTVSDRHEGRVDVLVTDVVMPGMSGGDLAGLVQERRPGTRVLYISGYSHATVSGQGLADAGRRLLEKPFTGTELLAAVRDALVLDANNGPADGASR